MRNSKGRKTYGDDFVNKGLFVGLIPFALSFDERFRSLNNHYKGKENIKNRATKRQGEEATVKLWQRRPASTHLWLSQMSLLRFLCCLTRCRKPAAEVPVI